MPLFSVEIHFKSNNMEVLVVGASGATGRLVVEQLLNRKVKVKAMLRSTEKNPEFINRENLELITASILDLDDEVLLQHVKGCNAVVSCLGHNLTFRGLFGKPRRLVTEATRKLCKAISEAKSEKPVKYLLMNTTGNRNRDLDEHVSFVHKAILTIIRLLLPPQADNEQAADFLRTNISKNIKQVEWVAVRPDNLTDEKKVSPYEIYPSPIRSAIFDPGKTSRINVAHFMAELITNEATWNKWKGQMPVIYNSGE